MLVTACFAADVGNGDFLPGNDQVGNMLFRVNLLKRHSFTISPPDAPQAFFRTIERPGEEPVPTAVDEWTVTSDTAYREGRLAVRSHFSYMSPTVFPEAYVNTFGIGAPLAGLPVYAVLDLSADSLQGAGQPRHLDHLAVPGDRGQPGLMQFLDLFAGRAFRMGRGSNWRIVHPEMGARRLTLNHGLHEPGQEFTQHLHDESEDMIVVLEGGGSVRQGDVYTPIEAGEGILVPAQI